MRRSERAVNDFEQVSNLLNNNKIFYLGINDKDFPYIVPLCYGFEVIEDKFVLYFHCATSGKKNDLLSKNSNVAFVINDDYQLLIKDNLCSSSMLYASLMGSGLAVELLDNETKSAALNIITSHQMNKKGEFSSEAIKRVAVYQIAVCDWSMKTNRL
jgi:uncharacterized protein